MTHHEVEQRAVTGRSREGPHPLGGSDDVPSDEGLQ